VGAALSVPRQRHSTRFDLSRLLRRKSSWRRTMYYEPPGEYFRR